MCASTQNQALSALLFLFRDVLQNLPWLDRVVRAKRPIQLPVVLSREEVASVLGNLSECAAIMGNHLYGSGMRVMECVRLRVMAIDFGRCMITFRQGKGRKDRTTILPETLRTPLRRHLERVGEIRLAGP